MENRFSMDQGGGGWFPDDSNTLHVLCTLFLLLLHQLHLRSSGIISWRLGAPALKLILHVSGGEQGYPLFSWELPPSFLDYLRSLASYQLETQLKLSVQGFPGGPVVKNLSPYAGNKGSIPDPGRSHMLRGK